MGSNHNRLQYGSVGEPEAESPLSRCKALPEDVAKEGTEEGVAANTPAAGEKKCCVNLVSWMLKNEKSEFD